jgi:hypothetical protein
MMRYEVRIEEIDGSTDIVPVWAPSDEEAISLAVTWIDYVERRPMYNQPASASVIGSAPEEDDLSDTTTSPNDVAHRRISRDGLELGTLRRPVRQRLIELRGKLMMSESAGWRELREQMNKIGLSPEDCAVVSAELDAVGDPLFGILISRLGSHYGFVRDEGGRLSIGDAQDDPKSTADPLVARLKMALELLNEPGS